jgi:hypothetical protein
MVSLAVLCGGYTVFLAEEFVEIAQVIEADTIADIEYFAIGIAEQSASLLKAVSGNESRRSYS